MLSAASQERVQPFMKKGLTPKPENSLSMAYQTRTSCTQDVLIFDVIGISYHIKRSAGIALRW